MPMPSPGNFWKNRRGAVAVTVALAAVTLFVAAGVAVDMARAYRAQHALQYNVDQAAIAAAAVAYSENPGADPDINKMEQVAAKYFAANNALSEDLVVVIEPPQFSYSDDDDDLVVSVPATVETTFLKIADINEIKFTVSSNVVRPEWGPLELVLALDRTWSMSALLNGTPKYVTLQKAAKDLVTQLSASANTSVGIVPFATYLKVPSNYWGESWIKIPPPYSSAGTVCTYPNKKGCTMVPGRSFDCIRDGVPATCYNDPYETCTDLGEPYCYGSPGEIFSFDGCISSRVGLLDSIDSATTIPYWGLFPFWNLNWGPCAQTPMLDLTKAAGAGKQTLMDRIDQLVPVNNAFSQNTYIAGGLEFAMHMLTPGLPFNTAVTNDVAQELGFTKAIVLMTDGINNAKPFKNYNDWGVSWWTADCSSNDGGAGCSTQEPRKGADDALRSLCTKAKNSGFVIFVVSLAVDESDVYALNMLQECASSPDNFFNAQTSEQLLSAFQRIGYALKTLRITG